MNGWTSVKIDKFLEKTWYSNNSICDGRVRFPNNYNNNLSINNLVNDIEYCLDLWYSEKRVKEENEQYPRVQSVPICIGTRIYFLENRLTINFAK